MLHVESFQRQVAQTIKIDDWRAWAQYMYRDWRPSESHTCRGLSVRLGDSLHRAETPLHGWGKGHPVQKATPVPQERPNLGTNSLKFQLTPKFTQAPRAAGVGPFGSKLGTNLRIASE